VVPLLVAEPVSEAVESLLREDESVAVWWSSRVECVSALRRRERDGSLTIAAVEQALRRLDVLAREWSEVAPTGPLRLAAERALAVHPLRVADALQLAAGLAWRGSMTSGHHFVCLDRRLRDAASREGFAVLPAEPV
jgi:predicted nucleic acid-binding protein